ncbi:MAG: hypothetical protein EBX41_03725 [Chitinophagia bacterium]|nr:hypothetical protein [Chitinophagia bacterium]
MYYDDFDDFESGPIEDTLRRYEIMKTGGYDNMLDEEEFEQIIEHYLHNSSEDQALQACEVAGKYYPYSTNILILKAEIYIQRQKYGQAMKTLDAIDILDASNIDSVLMRSDIWINTHRTEKATQWLTAQAERFEGKEKAEILLELSDVYEEEMDFDKAFDAIIKILDFDKRNEEALQKICFLADFTGRLYDSITLHNALLEEDPVNCMGWYNLGSAYQGLKLYEKAIDAYLNCIAIDDTYEYAYRNLADAYMRTKKYEHALDALNDYLQIGKPEDIIYISMGKCHDKMKNYATARAFYFKALELSPGDANIHFCIGKTYIKEKLWNSAIQTLLTAITLTPKAVFSISLAECYKRINKMNAAVEAYKEAIIYCPPSKKVYVALIKGILEINSPIEALSQLKEAEDVCGYEPEFCYLKAAACLYLGKNKEALLNLEIALKEAPNKKRLFCSVYPDYANNIAIVKLIDRYGKG